MPKVSVLLPARNAAETLPAALGSIAKQTFRDFEVVVVDDASTDGTAQVLARFTSSDRRFRVIRGEGRGIVAALEAGRAACGGAYVARMDADDLAHPLRLAEQVAALDADPTLAGVGCRVAMVPRRAVGEGMRLHLSWLNGLSTPEDVLRERFRESPLVHPAATVRAEWLRYRDLPWPEDYDLFLSILGAGGRLLNLPGLRLFWREHGGRLTRRDPRYAKEAHLRLKAHHLARGPLAGRPVAIWGAGKTGRALARCLAAEGVPVAFFVDVDPAKVGGTRRGAPVLSPDRLPPPGDALLLIAVAARGARAQIDPLVAARGYLPGRDVFGVTL